MLFSPVILSCYFCSITIKAALAARARNMREHTSGKKQKPQGHKSIYLIAVIFSKTSEADFPKQEVRCWLY